MTQTAITKQLNKTAGEMKEIIKKSKRKLLELEVMMSLSDIAVGRVKIYKKAEDFFKTLR